MTKDANNGSALIKPFSLAVKLVFKIKPNLTFLSATKSHLNRNLIANIDRKFDKIIKLQSALIIKLMTQILSVG